MKQVCEHRSAYESNKQKRRVKLPHKWGTRVTLKGVTVVRCSWCFVHKPLDD